MSVHKHVYIDHLSGPRMDNEIRLAAECARIAGAAESEDLARSYGL